MATGLTLQDKPSVIITDSGLGRSRHTGTVATEVGHTQLIHYVRLCFTHNMHMVLILWEIALVLVWYLNFSQLILLSLSFVVNNL